MWSHVATHRDYGRGNVRKNTALGFRSALARGEVLGAYSNSAARLATSLRSQAVKVMLPKQGWPAKA